MVVPWRDSTPHRHGCHIASCPCRIIHVGAMPRNRRGGDPRGSRGQPPGRKYRPPRRVLREGVSIRRPWRLLNHRVNARRISDSYFRAPGGTRRPTGTAATLRVTRATSSTGAQCVGTGAAGTPGGRGASHRDETLEGRASDPLVGLDTPPEAATRPPVLQAARPSIVSCPWRDSNPIPRPENSRAHTNSRIFPHI